jgi:hypothetical protein
MMPPSTRAVKDTLTPWRVNVDAGRLIVADEGPTISMVQLEERMAADFYQKAIAEYGRTRGVGVPQIVGENKEAFMFAYFSWSSRDTLEITDIVEVTRGGHVRCGDLSLLDFQASAAYHGRTLNVTVGAQPKKEFRLSRDGSMLTSSDGEILYPVAFPSLRPLYPGHSPTLHDALKYHLSRKVLYSVEDALSVGMKQHQSCLRALAAMNFGGVAPNCKLAIFGSAISGFGSLDSDIDCTILTPGDEPMLPPPKRYLAFDELEQKALPLFLADPNFELAELVRAKIPVLKLRFRGTVDVDVTFNNSVPILNTNLLRAYHDIWPGLTTQAHQVKRWAKENGVYGAKQGFLSSYSFNLLTIYYLQTQMGLPVLQTSDFVTSRISLSTAPPYTKPYTPTGGDRFLSKFLHFYAFEFHWGTEVVSVRLGCRRRRAHFTRLAGSHLERFHIEDPFLVERNLNCPLRLENEVKLLSALRWPGMDGDWDGDTFRV